MWDRPAPRARPVIVASKDRRDLSASGVRKDPKARSVRRVPVVNPVRAGCRVKSVRLVLRVPLDPRHSLSPAHRDFRDPSGIVALLDLLESQGQRVRRDRRARQDRHRVAP